MNRDQNNTRSQKESEDSFSNLYDSHFAIFCVYVYRFIPDKEICTDLVQESFARLWKNRRMYFATGTQLQFLYTTVRNLALNRIRHEKIKRNTNFEYDRHSSIELDMIENEVKGIIWRAIIQLPSKYREIISLFLRGYSMKEISQILKKPLQTIKNNKSIGIKLLKEKLMELYGNELK